jgi:hypothetical protein
VIKQIKDPLLKSFWEDEFSQFRKDLLTEIIAPIQNKVGQVLLSPMMRNILGQVKSKIDMRFMMDNKRIFIANLSKGKIGEDKANLLGSIILSKFQLAAMSRSDCDEKSRENFFLYADEFHNFTTESFTSMLSEARKYGLAMTLANQYGGQLRDEIRRAVLGNVGSIISFRVGGEDAEHISREFGWDYSPKALTELPNWYISAKLTVLGEDVGPNGGKTLPPLANYFGNRENIIRRSREKYSTPRKTVEDKIRRWLRS